LEEFVKLPPAFTSQGLFVINILFLITVMAIGVGAGKFLGVRRNFARILPNLPEKYFKTSDLQKALHVSLGAM